MAATISTIVLLPATAWAETGGQAAPQPGAPPPQQSGPIRLLGPGAALVNRPTRLRGLVAGGAGSVVSLNVLESGRGWTYIGSAAVDKRGGFSLPWRPSRAGRSVVVAQIDSSGGATSAETPAAGQPPPAGSSQPPTAVQYLTVHRRSGATWYGPGFYGNRTACGIKLTRSTQGVAHRTLPCGTLVSLYYHGRRAVVPVIDRGPFDRRASWDLTEATARRLGMRVSDRIGVLAPV